MIKTFFFSRGLMHKSHGRVLCLQVTLFIFVIMLSASCTQKMSIEDAKQVVVSMVVKEAFIPPPRRVNDIINVLDKQLPTGGETITRLRELADTSPPENENMKGFARFYSERGHVAWELGRDKQALEDYRMALHYTEKGGRKGGKILRRLSQVERRFGNFRRAVELLERAQKVSTNPGMYNNLISTYAKIGDIERAKKAKIAGIIECNRPRRRSKPSSIRQASDMESKIFELEGKNKEAEFYIRKAIEQLSKNEKDKLIEVINHRIKLAANLSKQERLLEAEIEARKAFKEAIEHGGKDSVTTWNALDNLANVILAQGRLKDAEDLIRAEIRLLENLEISSDTHFMTKAKMSLGNLLADKREFSSAVEQFDTVSGYMRKNPYTGNIWFRKTLNMMLSLIMVGRGQEALPWLTNKFEKFQKQFGEDYYLTAEVRGLRGLAYAKANDHKRAVADISKAIPALLEAGQEEGSDYSRINRFKLILEAFIELLSQIRNTELEEDLQIDAVAEAFRLADASRGRSTLKALIASSARAASLDANLAELIRREQDAQNQIDEFQQLLLSMITAPKDEQLPRAIKDLHVRIDRLSRARKALTGEIKSRFPEYSNMVSPQPGSISLVKRHLRSSEVFISIYTSEDRTYVWSIPHRGEIKFATVGLGKKQLNQIVDHLRLALDPKPETFGGIPEFDLERAYDLYSKLLKPVEDSWKNAEKLLIVASGSLGQLPFSVLPTASVKLRREKGELFANYRKVPWLIRKASITRLPSVSSFVTLRTIPEGDPKRKAFAGFGDPLFNRFQLAQAESERGNRLAASSGQSIHVRVRGIRFTEVGNLDNDQISSSRLDSLNRLPDTAEEIKVIANALGADPVKDIFLREKASERLVKTMDLSDRRVIVFASHALVPGDLDGLNQPAIALSAPSVTGDDEDGLLTMGEVMKLKLNADWIVLSACNTGAAEGAGAEAVSGLGRAFFYAGTRALLVSMWPVETTSAKNLTTGLFQYQKEDTTISRARALQKSMLALIDSPGLKDYSTDKIIASYAHPIFWAPFIVVGDGG